MPLSCAQTTAIKDLLRRASELIADAQAIAATACDPSAVASLKQLRKNVADEIASLSRKVAP
jgi:hypothetical protein